MSLARHKSRRVNEASIPPACEVCREGPVTTLVADFIFPRSVSAKTISAVLWHGREERTLTAGFSSEFRNVISPNKDTASLEMQKVKAGSNGKNI
jgi:hypothetical protein